MFDCQRSWIEISKEALRHNVKEISYHLNNKTQLMAVVKADAYGHGAVNVCQELNKMGIQSFAVATLSEAIELRENHIKGDILILGYTDPSQSFLIHKYDFIQTIIDEQYAYDLEKEKTDIKVHIAIDSGMHRLGINVNELNMITSIYQLSHLHICGLFSHLCVADELTTSSQNYTLSQIDSFMQLINILKQNHYDVGHVHILSSYGLLNYPKISLDYVRMGILLYGVDSSYPKQSQFNLKPVLSLKSKIAMIRKVKANETIGYGRSFQATQDMKIAIVPIGYADGIPRSLSNQGQVIVRGQFASIIGRICMDQMMIDVSHIKGVCIHDIVTIIGQDQYCRIGVEDIAKVSNTISNEILSCIGFRLPKIYK